MIYEDIENRFSLHKVGTSETIDVMSDIRYKMMHLALDIDQSMNECREKSLAITKLEECLMWTNKGITKDGEEV